MPEFILPAEGDHCPHCGEMLRDPPNCCEQMAQEHSEEMHRKHAIAEPLPIDDERPSPCFCNVCGKLGRDCRCEDGDLDPDYDYPTYEDYR